MTISHITRKHEVRFHKAISIIVYLFRRSCSPFKYCNAYICIHRIRISYYLVAYISTHNMSQLRNIQHTSTRQIQISDDFFSKHPTVPGPDSKSINGSRVQSLKRLQSRVRVYSTADNASCDPIGGKDTDSVLGGNRTLRTSYYFMTVQLVDNAKDSTNSTNLKIRKQKLVSSRFRIFVTLRSGLIYSMGSVQTVDHICQPFISHPSS